MEGQIAFSRNLEGQESSYSDSNEENSKNICHFVHISMYACLSSKLCIHVGISLKVMYSNKQVFFRDDIGTSKCNTSPWGLRSL